MSADLFACLLIFDPLCAALVLLLLLCIYMEVGICVSYLCVWGLCHYFIVLLLLFVLYKLYEKVVFIQESKNIAVIMFLTSQILLFK